MDVSDPHFWKSMEPTLFSVTKGVWAPGFTRDDLINEARVGIWEASLVWSPDKGSPWKVFAYVCARRRVLELITHSNRKKNKFFFSVETLERTKAYNIPDMELLPLSIKLRQKLYEMINNCNLTAKERSVIDLFLLDYSYKEIADELNTTYKSVDNCLQRAFKKLKVLVN